MAKGGARARSGPPPDPNALRRERDSGEWVTLPAEGRPGKPPRFPLTKQTARERTLWKNEWSRPQAIMWERNRQELEVALYVRSVADAEKPGASANIRNLVKQLQEALGISLPGLHRNRWRIEPNETSQTAAKPNHRAKPKTSAKSRFRVIDGGGT